MFKVFGIFLVFCFVCFYTYTNAPQFVGEYNLGNLVRWIGLFGILSIGVSFVIVGGGIDLSIGSVVGLIGTLLPFWLVAQGKGQPTPQVSPFGWFDAVPEWAHAAWVGVAACIVGVVCVSILIGLTHGLLVTKVRLQPFVVTLCGLLFYRGVARYLTDDNIQGYRGSHDGLREIAIGKPFLMTDVAQWLGVAMAAYFALGLALSFRPSVRGGVKRLGLVVGTLSGLGLARGGWWVSRAALAPRYADHEEIQALSTLEAPMPFLIMVAIAILATMFLNRTVWGRHLFAVGRNEQAARYSGVRTDRIVILSYVLCAMLAGLGGVLFSLDLNSVEPDRQGNFYELYAIAAAVLGGCSLRGGEGTIVGVLIGCAVMRVLNNSIILLDIPSQLEFAIIGIVILVGVIADEAIRRMVAWMRATMSKRRLARG